MPAPADIQLNSNVDDSAIIMGFDFGTQSIGIAIGQQLTGTTTPLKPIKARDGKPDWLELGQIIEQWQPRLFVIGIPLNMDASESELSRRASQFGRRLEGRFGIPWQGMDERLSSFEVKSSLQEQGQKHAGPIDSLAAAIILESWMRSN